MADFLGMMKQAAQLQSKMQAMQEELGNVEVEGISGGGLVAVRMTAKMEVKAIKIDPSLMKAEEREILEDLLVTAHNDARRKAEAAMQEKMQALTGGLACRPDWVSAEMAASVAGPEIERLIQLLARLPGLGPRSARRAALHLIKKREALMTPLAGALQVAIEQASRSARPAAISIRKIPARSAPIRGAIPPPSSWSPTSPISGRWNAPMRPTAAITCSAPRCRRSTASVRRI